MFNRSYESARFGFVDFGPHHDAIGFLLLVFDVMAIYGSFYQNR
ncbi:hypothetical protein [Terasakiispira papahanaumokuakeensis]|nr:hypothetical protein [Terasakiispira papahanaumokuakeensis]